MFTADLEFEPSRDQMRAQPMTSIAAFSLATVHTDNHRHITCQAGKDCDDQSYHRSRYGRHYGYDGYLKILTPDDWSAFHRQ